MSKLRGELAHAFVGAIVAIARDNGAIDVPESTALRQVVHTFVDSSDFDLEIALFSQGTMSEFAELLRASVASPFRGVAAIRSIDAVVTDFVRAARMVALADGSFAPEQERLLREFLSEIGRAHLFDSNP